VGTKASLTISSAAFQNGANIPPEFTCEGDDKNPPLTIEGAPKETKSLVLIMDDPDAPGKTFDHWIVWNIKPQRNISEDSNPGETGRNSLGRSEYTGPCPPSGTHRYFFKVYALDGLLDLKKTAVKRDVEQAMEDHILAYGELIGLYKKKVSKKA
jgi:hypothetical protein